MVKTAINFTPGSINSPWDDTNTSVNASNELFLWTYLFWAIFLMGSIFKKLIVFEIKLGSRTSNLQQLIDKTQAQMQTYVFCGKKTTYQQSEIQFLISSTNWSLKSYRQHRMVTVWLQYNLDDTIYWWRHFRLIHFVTLRNDTTNTSE